MSTSQDQTEVMWDSTTVVLSIIPFKMPFLTNMRVQGVIVGGLLEQIFLHWTNSIISSRLFISCRKWWSGIREWQGRSRTSSKIQRGPPCGDILRRPHERDCPYWERAGTIAHVKGWQPVPSSTFQVNAFKRPNMIIQGLWSIQESSYLHEK